MAKVKIGDVEYKLESLTALDLKKLNKEKEDKKISDYDQTFTIYLYAIKKFNDNVKMSLEEFMDSFPLSGMQKKMKEINEITGINFTQPKKIS
ncbi:hypothetical protein KAX02_05640 [candidate division WOR-3 bacterium]|nr:hypothetical protein [candidate division WOR-3 bacterium]